MTYLVRVTDDPILIPVFCANLRGCGFSEFVGVFASFDGDGRVDETLDGRPDDVGHRIRRVDRRQMLQRRQEGHGQGGVGDLWGGGQKSGQN